VYTTLAFFSCRNELWPTRGARPVDRNAPLGSRAHPTPVAFVRQQNIGVNQQVNNGPIPQGEPSCTRGTEIEQPKLLEAQHSELVDTRTASQAIDPTLETVGEIDWPIAGRQD
jgi:hypothetical protein